MFSIYFTALLLSTCQMTLSRQAYPSVALPPTLKLWRAGRAGPGTSEGKGQVDINRQADGLLRTMKGDPRITDYRSPFTDFKVTTAVGTTSSHSEQSR